MSTSIISSSAEGGGSFQSPLKVSTDYTSSISSPPPSPDIKFQKDNDKCRILIRNAPIVLGFDMNGVYDCIGEKEYQHGRIFKIIWKDSRSEWRVVLCGKNGNIVDCIACCESDADNPTPDLCARGIQLCEWHVKSEFLFCCSTWVPCPSMEVLDVVKQMESKRKRISLSSGEMKRLDDLNLQEEKEKKDALIEWIRINAPRISLEKRKKFAEAFCNKTRDTYAPTIGIVANRLESKWDLEARFLAIMGLDSKSINQLVSAMKINGLLTDGFIEARSNFIKVDSFHNVKGDYDDNKEDDVDDEEEDSNLASKPTKANGREVFVEEDNDFDDDDDKSSSSHNTNNISLLAKFYSSADNKKDVLDKNTFTEVCNKYVCSVDGVEGWLTRIIAPPSDSGPPIKKKEWFILYGNALYYFPDKPEDKLPLKIKYCSGYILLNSNTDVVIERAFEFGFDLISPSCMTMNMEFCAESESDLWLWTLALKHFIAKYSSSSRSTPSAAVAVMAHIDSIFCHSCSKQFLDSRSSNFMTNSEGLLHTQRESFVRSIALDSFQSLSTDCSLYNVLGGLFNVSKWTEGLLRNKQSDYWLFLVGGRLLCNQQIESMFAGASEKNFNVGDFIVEKVTHEKGNLEEMLVLTVNEKLRSLTQKYSAKEDSSFFIQNLVTIVSEMKLTMGQKSMKNLHIYDQFQELKVETTPILLSATVKAALQNHYFSRLFGDFSGTIKTLSKCIALPGDFIAKEHQLTDNIVIMESGVVEVSRNNKSIGLIEGFFVFFDWTVFYSAAHLSSIRALSKCHLILIERKYFKNVIRNCVESTKKEKVEALKNVKLLENLAEDKIDRLSDLMFRKSFSDGEVIIKQGDPGDAFYMLKKGTIAITKDGFQVSRLKAPGAFGELALINNQPRAATIRAIGPVECYCIRKDGFLSNMGDLKEAENESFAIKILKKMDIFFDLSDAKLLLIARALEKRPFAVEEHIITQGAVGDCFYIVATGAVSVQINHMEVALLSPGNFFGEMALLNNDKRGATIVAKTPVECFCINKASFNSVLGPLADKLRVKAEKRASDNKKAMAGERQRSSSSALFDFILSRKSSVVDDAYDWSALKPSKVLSNGQFSSILLAVDTKTTKNYVLKVYSDRKVKMYPGLTQQIENEVRIQSIVDSNFFVSLFNNTRVDGFIVLQLQYMNGDSLARLLHDRPKGLLGQSLISGGVSSKVAVHYLSNILYAVQYLHDLDIVHRDICLENIMVDGSGNIKVLDFSCSKTVIDSSRLYTICGKPEYLAPDMILMNGYTFSVDIWSLGILFYELLTRRTPFQGSHQNEVIFNIMTAPIPFDGLEEDCRHFLSGVLQKKQSLRLGMQKHGLADIWKHPLIEKAGYTQENVGDRRMPPPLVLDNHEGLVGGLVASDDDNCELGNIHLDFESCHDFIPMKDGKVVNIGDSRASLTSDGSSRRSSFAASGVSPAARIGGDWGGEDNSDYGNSNTNNNDRNTEATLVSSPDAGNRLVRTGSTEVTEEGFSPTSLFRRLSLG